MQTVHEELAGFIKVASSIPDSFDGFEKIADKVRKWISDPPSPGAPVSKVEKIKKHKEKKAAKSKVTQRFMPSYATGETKLEDDQNRYGKYDATVLKTAAKVEKALKKLSKIKYTGFGLMES